MSSIHFGMLKDDILKKATPLFEEIEETRFALEMHHNCHVRQVTHLSDLQFPYL